MYACTCTNVTAAVEKLQLQIKVMDKANKKATEQVSKCTKVLMRPIGFLNTNVRLCTSEFI